MDSTSRYNKYGAKVRLHKGKPYKDLVSSRSWTTLLTQGLENAKYKISQVPVSMEYRPDLIADAAYGNKNLWWLVCTANNISDPTTELKAGKQIFLPII